MDLVTALDYTIAFISLFSMNFFILLYLTHRKEYLDRPEDDGSRPLISIIIPAYNEGAYISDCLKTVKSLDYPKEKLDVIVVDDGSTDDTFKRAKAFEGSNLRVLRKENGGKGAALNFGLKHAKGEFVATMDADSYLEPNILIEMLPFFKEKDVMAVTPAVRIKQTDKWLSELQRVEYLMILFSRKLLNYVDSVPVTPGPFSLFRASVFNEVGVFDEHNLVEDQEIALRIQSHNFKIRSSMTALVYTEPPDNMNDLMRQRVRWQRGGLRNYWYYRFMIKPDYGDFGMYFVPMNFVTIIAFFTVLGLLIYSSLTTPYYTRYILIESFGMGIDLFTFIVVFVVLTTTVFVYLAVKSFNEKVKMRYLLSFLIFYWYLMIGYNVLTLVKELRKESFSW